MTSHVEKPTYSDEQLQQYFEQIRLPARDIPKHIPIESPDFDLLCKLIHCQLCHVPFENLDLHYSAQKKVSLDVDHLFHKIVLRRAGRGGYCMQLNAFFATVLRSLGYSVTSVAGHVYGSSEEGQPEVSNLADWNHQVNIVTINRQRFAVDVGFGNAGPTMPMLLEDGFSRYNTGSRNDVASTMKLTKEVLSGNPQQVLWVYSVRFDKQNKTAEFQRMYCFLEREFSASEFQTMSDRVSTSEQSMFVQKVICQKFLASEDGEELVGDITLDDGELKERRYGKSKVLEDLGSESDRVSALEVYMGVKLSSEEVDGIKGHHTELKVDKKQA